MGIQLKIGRHTYDITEDDRFLDNGACVQLLTQSKEKNSWGSRANPVLSKRAVKQLAGMPQAEYPYRAFLGPSEGLRHFGITEITK